MRLNTRRVSRSIMYTAVLLVIAAFSIPPAFAVDFPESAHPYSNNFDFTWTWQSGVPATYLDVTFDEQTFLAAGDRLFIMDSFGTNIAGSPFTGGSLGGMTVRVPGGNVQLRLQTDALGTGYGFKVANIVPLNIPAPDLWINKTHNGKFRVGEAGTYTIVVRNIGNGATTGPVTVTDQLPAGLNATSIGGEGWICSQPGGPCQQTEILSPRGAFPQLILNVTVGPVGAGTVINRATVSGGGDSNTGNNTVEDPTEVEALGPDFRITKSHTGNFTQGQAGATYTIQVTNLGPGPSMNGTVEVTDTLPAGLTATSMTGQGWSCTQPGGPCVRADFLPAGGTFPDITLTVNVSPTAPTNVTNVAKVAGAADSDSSNDTANDHTVINVNGPDLRITKTHAGNFTQAQNGATYTITVRNHGNQPSSGLVTVTDTVPAGLTAVSIAGDGWNCTQPAGPCTRSDALAVNTSYPPITLTVNVVNNAPGSVINTATVAGGGDADSSNNTVTDPTTILGNPTCTPLPESQHPYPNNFDFTWTCVVDGNIAAVEITFDAQTSLLNGDFIHLTNGVGTPIAGSPFTGQSLAGQTKTVAGNTARIRLVTDGAGQDYGFRITNIVGVPAGNPDLTITKTHSGNFVRAQVGAQYTIVVQNVGTAASSGQVTVTDTVPAGMVATNIAGNGWNCTQPAGPCTRSDSLGVGLSYPALTLTVNVAANAPATLTNIANVSGGGDPNPANNSASDPTQINVPVPSCNPLPESTHPYENELDQSWTCVQPGNPSSIDVAFDPQTLFEGNDFLYVMDKNGNNIPGSPFTGNTLAGAVKNIPGDTLRLRLVSDLRRTEWGFRVTSITSVASVDPDLTITKTHNGNFVQGQNGATYTIVVRNNGGGSSIGLVTVTDNVPAGLTPVGIGGTGWNCTQPAGPCTRSDALAPGLTYPPITLTVNVSGTAPAQVTNIAAVSGGGDTIPGNNTAVDPTTVLSPAGCVLPESPHPYENDFDQTYTCTVAGNPSSLNVTFDAQTAIDPTDLLYVMNGSNVNIPGSPFTGAALAGQTKSVPGDTVRIRLVTDGRRTDWGFKVTSIVGLP